MSAVNLNEVPDIPKASAQALQQVTSTVSEPMNLQASVSAFDCSNSPGPWINFEGGSHSRRT